MIKRKKAKKSAKGGSASGGKVKKVKKTKKGVKALKVKKAVKKKKSVKTKKVKKIVSKAKALPKEKVLGRIEHFFDKISVAAASVKAPFKVGDVIHVKGHTTDFCQRVESMQIEHQSVSSVKKGDDVGIRVKDFCREHDVIFQADEKSLSAQPAKTVIQQPTLFQASVSKPASKPASKPLPTPPPLLDSNSPGKADPYSKTKFINF